MSNIGIMGDVFFTWGGGIDFLSLVSRSIDKTKHKFFILLPKKQGNIGLNMAANTFAFLQYQNFPNMDSIRDYYYRMSMSWNKSYGGQEKLLSTLKNFHPDLKVCYYVDDNDLVRILKEEKVDLCLPSSVCIGLKFPIPWIGYLYDLQHKYYPEFFKVSDINFRNHEFHRMVNNSMDVIVPSKSVKKDIEKFFSPFPARIHPIPFSAPGPVYDPRSDLNPTLDKYNIKNKYFIIMNQFWKHKNHELAFRALNKLKEGGISDIDIVCTGATNDHRFPEYFPRLEKYIKDNDLASNIHILGFLPKNEQLALLTGSIAVIQPSLFEGGPGGLASVDAVSYGIPLILSDIDVNHEVVADDISFFDPTNEDMLAEIMVKKSSYERPREEYSRLLQKGELSNLKLRSFINDLIDQIS